MQDIDQYSHQEIEQKWQNKWDENKSFSCHENSSKPKKYILDMFPYPSGAGLHVGHIMNYTATDIMSRYYRSKGYDVLHPMGWDSFGLPAEQYAVRTGTHPAITTQKNIDRYRSQLKKVGLSYDWSREFATSDPKYYKWTQWIFTKLYEKGLAYEAEMMVNYCPFLGTVLANEEVEDGKSVEGSHPVVRKPLKQWILKITAYAQRLLDDLDDLDWPEHLKNQQRHWIGRSEGTQVRFPIDLENKTNIEVFTTRPDTLMGVTFLVLSPEHPLVDQITSLDKKTEVAAYCEQACRKSDLDRSDLNRDKSGVFTGGYAHHPITQKPIPIWIADYVLMSYGTGSVMAVAAHDERDHAFATKYGLSIKRVIQSEDSSLPYLGQGVIINSDHNEFSLNGLDSKEASLYATQWLEERGLGERKIQFRLRDWLFSRQRYWGEPIPIVHLADGTQRPLALDELPLLPPEIEDYRPAGDGRSPLSKVKSWVERDEGLRETNTMPQWAGSCWYYLRFCDPHNEKEAWSLKKENYWMPVDIYVGGVEHAVLHLLYSRFWHKVLYDLELVTTKEPFACLRNQGMVVSRSYKTSSGEYVSSTDISEKEGEYFRSSDGSVLISQVEKMSKSKLNGVSPDEIMSEYGADALRLYEMFMGPFDKEKVWTTQAVSGCYRFLKRVWNLSCSERVCSQTKEGLALTHALIKSVEEDLVHWQFNTAIAKMMEWINEATKLEKISLEAISIFTRLLYPFAPHICSEIWEYLFKDSEISSQDFPSVDLDILKELTPKKSVIVIQVNGKIRAKMDVADNLKKEEAIQLAKSDQNIERYLSNATIIKEIWVEGKLINFVVKPT